MFRTLPVVVCCLLAAFPAVAAGPGIILDITDKLTDKEPAYKPDAKNLTELVDKLAAMAVDGQPHKVYTVKLSKGEKVVIELKSKDFDAVVAVEDTAKKILALNDDVPGAETNDARLSWSAPADGEYRIVVAAADKKLGAFRLTLSRAK